MIGRVLAQRQVCAVLAIVADVLAKQSAEVPFPEDYDVVEHLCAAAQNPALGRSVLPGGPVSCPYRLDTQRLDHGDDSWGELRVAVEDQVARRGLEGERLPELMDDPRRCGVGCDIEVEDLATGVVDDEQDVEDAEGDGRDGEEIHGGDDIPMVPEEGPPVLPGSRWCRPLWHVTGNCALGDLDPELEQLSVDSGCTPGWILPAQATDEITNIAADPWTSRLLRLGLPPPVPAESRPMPSNHGRRLHDGHGACPLGPRLTKPNPEHAIGI